MNHETRRHGVLAVWSMVVGVGLVVVVGAAALGIAATISFNSGSADPYGVTQMLVVVALLGAIAAIAHIAFAMRARRGPISHAQLAFGAPALLCPLLIGAAVLSSADSVDAPPALLGLAVTFIPHGVAWLRARRNVLRTR